MPDTPLYREDLESQGCDVPGCHTAHEPPLHLQARCHPKAGLSVAYDGGQLCLACRVCGRPTCRVVVAARGELLLRRHPARKE